jgi:hypothetical protein
MAKKVAKKAPAKKAPKAAKKPAPKAKAKAPKKISTGSGASPAELGKMLVEKYNAGQADNWIKTVWTKDIESIEGSGEVAKGLKELQAKWDWWMNKNDMLGTSAEGPYVGATGFAVKFFIHIRDKETNQEMKMSEVAVYSVKNGKIYREEFMYGGM